MPVQNFRLCRNAHGQTKRNRFDRRKASGEAALFWEVFLCLILLFPFSRTRTGFFNLSFWAEYFLPEFADVR